MEAAGKRRRTASKYYSDYVDTDEAFNTTAIVSGGRKLVPASKRSAAAAAGDLGPGADRHDSNCSSSSAGADSDKNDDSDAGDVASDEPEEGEEGGDNQQRLAAHLDAPLDKKSLQKLNKKVNATLAPNTQGNYEQYISVFKRWLDSDGFNKSRNQAGSSSSSSSKSKSCSTDIGNLPRDNVVNLLFRFFEWWIVQGRPGDPSVGGRMVSAGEYGRSAAMKLHSALQHHLDACRRAAGLELFVLNKAPPYDGLYKVYCSKKRDRMLVKALEEGTSKAIVHMSFGRDPYVRGVHHLLASDRPEDACLLSMYTAQVALVARGDDLRPRTLVHLATRLLSCVGPSTAMALTILQPPTAGKTLGSRPAYKGMLRAKLAAVCSVGNLFRWLVVRFKVLAEPIPRPGSRKLAKFFLWPGRAGEEMSRNSHGQKMEKLFAQLGVETTKLTHELRIFAAQLMYEMGVSLEVIQRIGHWLLDSFGTAYIVPGFTAEALLALAFWPGAAQKEFTGFWAERFHVAIPELLIQLLVPGLAALEGEAAAATADGKPNAEAVNLCKVLRMGAVVVVQDALELAEQFPNNLVHKILLEQPVFKTLLASHKMLMALGGFEPQRPLTVKESMKDLLSKHTQTLVEHINSALGLSVGLPGLPCSGAAGLNWQGWEQLQKESQQDLVQQQQHPLTPEEVMATLEKVAAGQLTPSAELVQRIRQQKDVLNEGENSSLPSSAAAAVPPTAAAQQGMRQTASIIQQAAEAEGPAVLGSGPTAAAAAGVASTPPPPAETQQHEATAAAGHIGDRPHTAAFTSPPVSSGHCAPNPGHAGQTARDSSPDIQVAFMVEEPQELMDTFSTPSGAKYSRQQLSERTVHTLTPGGTHCRAFYMGQNVQQVQHQSSSGPASHQLHCTSQGAPEQQQQQQRQASMSATQSQEPQGVPGQQQQQQGQQSQQHGSMLLTQTSQHPLLLLRQQQQQQQQLLDLVANQQKELARLQQQVDARTPQAQQQRHNSLDEPQPAIQQLQQQQAAMQQQMERLQQLLLQQQGAQQVDRLQQQGTAILNSMGSVDPIATIWQPYITSQPGLHAVLGAANSTSAVATVGTSSNQAAMLMAVLAEREERLVQRTVDGVAARLGGTTAAAAAPTLHTAGAAGDGQEGHVAGLEELLSEPAQQPNDGKQQSSKQQMKAKGTREKIGFPALSTHNSMVNLAEWYYVNPLGNTGKTPQDLESAGQEDNYSWRGGPRHRFQRWAEYEQLLKAVEAERDRQTAEERSRSNHPHRVAQVDAITAARQLDVQRQTLGLSLCEYREYINGKGKGYDKGKAKEAESVATE